MFRNRSTAASIRNIFLWKLISSLSFPFNIPLSIIVPSFRFRLLLHCITLIYRNEKNSRLKKKKRLESSYESEDRKTFSTSISHHGTKAIYTLLYISSIISISIWLIQDDIEIHCFFPLGSPNFLSFFLSISTGDRIVKRAVVYFSLREGIACFGRERNGATCEFRANKEGLLSRDFTEATPRNALLCRGSLRI